MMTPLTIDYRQPVTRSAVKVRDSGDYKSNSAFGNYNTIVPSNKAQNAPKGLQMPKFEIEGETAKSAMRMTYSGARDRATRKMKA